MATTVVLKWSPITKRESGLPLKASDIAGYAVEMSKDGAAFTKLTDNQPAEVTREVPNLELGVYSFRVACFDTRNRSAAPATGSITIEDTSPPAMILDLTVSISPSIVTTAR